VAGHLHDYLNMGVTLIGPGVPMLFAPNRPVLWGALAGTGSSTGGGSNGNFTGPYPSAISGLAGWWDAGATADLLDTSGSPVLGWNNAVGSLADKSGAGMPLSVYHYSSASSAPMATPRLNALLGGVGLNTIVPPNSLPATDQPLPVMDPDQGLLSAPLPIGSGQAWTLYLVWSRPNWRNSLTSPSCLLSANGTPILTVDNTGGSGNLTLFPGSASPHVLTSSMTRRHTHAIILRNMPGTGIDAWVDGSQLLAAGANPMASTLTESLLFLHASTSGGGAQCWFHEAAAWGHALSSGDISTLIACQGRWKLGVRKGVQLLVVGQSNAGYGLSWGSWLLMAQSVAYHLGALAYGVIGSWGSDPSATCLSGEPIYPVPAGDPLPIPYGFLNNSSGGPSSWPLSNDGDAIRNFLSSVATEDQADIAAILWPYSESDSCRFYSEKSTYAAAAQQFLTLIRGMLPTPSSGGSIPLLWWNAMPFPYSPGGVQMVREVTASFVSTPALNTTIVLPQTADAIPYTATQNANGTWVLGSNGQIHLSEPDSQRFGMEAGPVAARVILANSGGDTITSFPTGIPAVGGPQIVHAYLENSTTVILTIQHDAGTDVVIPNLAAQGQGFTVMDGGSVASPGPLVGAISCTRQDATHLQLTLAQALVSSAPNCLLFYPYGETWMGTGNAVTDNFSTIAPPTGWDVLADLNWSWPGNYQPTLPNNYPLQATTTPITLSSTSD
jgi:hypothetical protein